ncbi:biotin--[acetyl-CoA-carboxylase] ligase [Sphingomonas bacterium]|uniref:biotin--[acetyl-CoA-carboxylase] ligase n=1 Tax=Sphingomonas bacterium TaxID=1895847 RepID=UPI0015760E0B|nr:biotin--[acetyl-CoA-carboxylase] ligase [Sphingomonas bacterium]
MLALASLGLEEGVWLRAERQSAGRGREGREWVSPAGNLHASTLVRVRPGDPAAPGLALVAGVAVAETLATLPFRFADQPNTIERSIDGASSPDRIAPSRGGVALKWPNDVLLAGAKVAGILLERAGDAVVIGVGVNVAHHPDALERSATSLAAHGVSIAPDALLRALGPTLAHHVGLWRTTGIDAVRERWLAFAHPVGTPLAARLPDGSSLHGRFAGLSSDGALRLGLAGDIERVIHAGDVFAV